MKEQTIGCHLSAAKGYLAMGKSALEIGANTFAFFTRNPRGGKAKALDQADADALNALCRAHGFGRLVAHAPYTLNACSSDPKTRAFARLCMAEDLMRMEATPHQFYNFHPGSHVGQGVEIGVSQTAELLNELLQDGQTTTVLFETMAGQGSEIGSTFEQLAELISSVERRKHVGVCFDTCHAFAAGYDVKTDLDGVLTQFDRVIGLDRLCALHLNDSKFPLGAHKDRHARIGEGEIGKRALWRIANHEALIGLPMILETPNELMGYAEEIRLLRGAEPE